MMMSSLPARIIAHLDSKASTEMQVSDIDDIDSEILHNLTLSFVLDTAGGERERAWKCLHKRIRASPTLVPHALRIYAGFCLQEFDHNNISRVGDLCRYSGLVDFCRESYALALLLQPSDGRVWNGLSALALSTGDCYSALYYYYRSLSVKRPFSADTRAVVSALKGCDSLFLCSFALPLLVDGNCKEDLDSIVHSLASDFGHNDTRVLLLLAMFHRHSAKELQQAILRLLLKFILNVDSLVMLTHFTSWLLCTHKSDNEMKLIASERVLVAETVHKLISIDATSSEISNVVLPEDWPCRGFGPLHLVFSKKSRFSAFVPDVESRYIVCNDDELSNLIEFDQQRKSRIRSNLASINFAGTMAQEVNSNLVTDGDTLILDTNIFMNQLEIVKTAHDSSRFNIMVPLTVINELHGLCLDEYQRTIITPALTFINYALNRNKLEDRKSFSLVTNTGKVKHSLTAFNNDTWHLKTHQKNMGKKDINADDVLISLAMELSSRDATAKFVLISDDGLLRMKAMSRNVDCITAEILRHCLS